ncbi:MAG: SusC/RagA family TonB-linked outer membrane protein [Bacteroidota bacterium]|nr:SusC/RagA family TonB-linked outer membrane protein [Bacteroidota bacterium]
MMKVLLKTYVIVLFVAFVFGTQGVKAQLGTPVAYTISGVVTDGFNGETIPGATVMIANTGYGTATDHNGNFSFPAYLKPDTYTLLFSFVGFKSVEQELVLAEQKTLTVDAKLTSDITGLDEVVVTGTSGFTKKSQLGNSISTVNSNDLGASGSVSIDAALQGNVAGAQVMRNSGNPAGGVSIRLRGASTVVGSSDPLYIIDGVIVNNNSTQLINLGGYMQNRMVDIDPKDIDHIEILKGAAAAAIYGSRASNGVIQIFTKRGVVGKPKITFSSSVNSNQVRKTLPYNDAQLMWDPDNAGAAIPATRYNYQDYMFENSYGYENYISVTGGQGNTKYLVSGSQLNNGGIVKNTDFKRNNFRVRIDQVINSWASISVGTMVSKNSSHEMPNGKNYGPITSLLFADNLNDPSPVDGVYPGIGWMANPYEAIDRIDAPQKNSRSVSDIQLKLTPLKGLVVNYIFGYDNAFSDARLFVPVGFNTKPNGLSEKATFANTIYNSDINASYSFDISSSIKSTTGVGYSYQYDETEYFAIRTDHLGPVSTVTDAGTVVGRSDYRTQRSIWGGYIQETLGISDKIFLTLAGRMDGASTFGVDQRQQFYPKASGSYILSEEDFFTNSVGGIFDLFKLRASWGQAGNLSALAPYSIYTSYTLAPINGQTGLVAPYTAGNPGLRPERQTETELGLDMGLFNGRLGIEFTWYKQNIEDLLLQRSLAPSTGFGLRYENIGTMTNTGVELMVRAEPVRNQDFRWLVTGIFSQNKNLVTHVEGGKLDLGMWGTSIAQSGQPLGIFYGYYFATNPDGTLLLTADGFTQRAKGHYEDMTLPDGEVIPVAVQDYDSDGQPSGSNLKKIIGDPNPDWVASLTNEFKYKNLSLFVKIDAVHGANVMSWDKRMFNLFPGGDATAMELNGDLPKGSARPNFFIYESFIEDGSFVKLREVSLSYDLGLDSDWIKSLRFTLSGSNLMSYDNYFGFDPEVNTEAQSNGVRGQDMANVPIPRILKFGLTATF